MFLGRVAPEFQARVPVNDNLPDPTANSANIEPISRSDTPYSYVGRALSHTARIVGLQFGTRDSLETLISVAEDRCDQRLLELLTAC